MQHALPLQQFEHIGMSMNQPTSMLCVVLIFTTVDQVRLWLACGELDRPRAGLKELDMRERSGTPFAHEREEVARVRVLLATAAARCWPCSDWSLCSREQPQASAGAM